MLLGARAEIGVGGEQKGRLMPGVRVRIGRKGNRICWWIWHGRKRGMVEIFPSSLTFHWAPRTSYTICRSQCKKKVWDLKRKCGTPFWASIGNFKTGRAEVGALLSVGPKGQHRPQASEANPVWLEAAPFVFQALMFLRNYRLDGGGGPKPFSTLSSEGISEHSGHRRSRASSEDWVGGAQPGGPAPNCLCATR